MHCSSLEQNNGKMTKLVISEKDEFWCIECQKCGENETYTNETQMIQKIDLTTETDEEIRNEPIKKNKINKRT